MPTKKEKEDLAKAIGEVSPPTDPSATETPLAAWDGFRIQAARTIQGSLVSLGTQLTNDVRQYAAEMSSDLAEALAIGREDLVAEIEGQALVLAERHRIALETQAKQVLKVVVGGLVGIGTAILTGFIPKPPTQP